MCASLCAKADILIKRTDFQAAKRVLLKAHKLKPTRNTDQKNIERNLKISKGNGTTISRRIHFKQIF